MTFTLHQITQKMKMINKNYLHLALN